MKLLAIDTATEACSAALLIDGDVTRQFQLAPRQHSRLILGMVDALLQQSGCRLEQLDALAFGRGPGSFMGVRIAAGVIQGLAFAHALPVVPVSTLAAIALRASEHTGSNRVLAAIDARMAEVYWGAYSRDPDSRLQLVGEEGIYPPARVPLPEGNAWTGAGTGWASYAEQLAQRLAGRVDTALSECYPGADAIARLAVEQFQQGGAVTAAEAVPVYLRDNVAKKRAALVSGR